MASQRLKFERQILLAEINRRYLALADTPADALRSPWDVAEWEDALAYGPLYKARVWFPGCSESQRVRLSRELAAMVREGLVTLSRALGARWPNVKLTPTGEAAVK